MSQFLYLLEQNKEAFEPWRALVVVDDGPLRRLVLNWSPDVVRRFSDYPAGDTVRDLWNCVDVDTQALGDLTGWGQPAVLATLRQAQGQRLIWPDGSLADPLVKLLVKRYQYALGRD